MDCKWEDRTPPTSKGYGSGYITIKIHPCLVQPVAAHGGEVMYVGSVCFRGELGFLNWDV